ncbi:MAG: nitrate/sulfonate/bicarbonate ABC transporter ATP-binding protein, partial [Proteobacteria bacterium]|nr:nitrate/sulfonate/bicarbonate ABC transporter ATP-binding protein [Pseudomonadota bacterium]
MDNATLLEVKGVRQAFAKAGGELVVLDGVSLELHKGEIVGLLGRSGCGKSTLLRLIAGLAKPVAGSLSYMGKPINGPAAGIAMVFQSFALFPWLTVLENVEIGLQAQGLRGGEVRERALRAIELIGLNGFEEAYPREMSGGMRQRVGFARALVVNPNILLMDEPFSALDVLTAETLRTDFLDLWAEKRLPIGGVLLVTHNIEEAVGMCDRVLVFASNPGRISSELKVDLPHPRSRHDPAFQALVEQIYVALTARAIEPKEFAGRSGKSPAAIATWLPRTSINVLAGLMETIAAEPYSGKADLPHIAARLNMEIDDLFPAAEALELMRFAEVEGGDIKLTAEGRHYAASEAEERKRVLAQHLMSHVPLAAHIRRVLDERQSHEAPRSRFADELEDHMSEEDAEMTLRAVIGWGRYAGLFNYDDRAKRFSLDAPA